VLADRVADVVVVAGELAERVDGGSRTVQTLAHDTLLILGHRQNEVGAREKLAVRVEIGGEDRVLLEPNAVLTQHETRVERGAHAVTRMRPDSTGPDVNAALEPAVDEHLLEQCLGHHAPTRVGLADEEDRLSHGCPAAEGSTSGRWRPTPGSSRGIVDPLGRCHGSASSRAGS